MVPERVARAVARAAALNFEMSCHPQVGRLLSVVTAAVPPGGRVLEIGTGAGVGTAWLVEGPQGRTDVELVTVDIDHDLVAAVQADDWPAWTTFIAGDALQLLGGLGSFNVIFADSPAGKWFGLDLTVAALVRGGVLVVDDMQPESWVDDIHRDNTLRVRDELLTNGLLAASELNCSTGIIVAARRHDGRASAAP